MKILILINLLLVESKKLFIFHNSYDEIQHISINDKKYRESGVMSGQEGYIYFDNVGLQEVKFNGGYIDYMDMIGLDVFYSKRKYTSSIFYSGSVKLIDSIIIMDGGYTINAFHMNFECRGTVDYTIELYKNGGLMRSFNMNKKYLSWFINDYNEYGVVYDIVLRNRGDMLVNCLECGMGYMNSYFWSVFREKDIEKNVSSVDVALEGIENKIIYHIYNIYETSK